MPLPRLISTCLTALFSLVPFAVAMEPVDMASFYPSSSKTAGELRFAGMTPSASVGYRIRDYLGDDVTGGRITVDANGGFSVPVTLPSGYYELTIEENGDARNYSFLRLPALSSTDRDASASDFFSIDAALSWLLPSGQRAERIARLPEVINGGLVRERLSWNAINPAPDRYDWETKQGYETVRSLYAENGLKVLEMFHDAPAWLRRAQEGKFPLDLPGASRSFVEIAKRWQGHWGALEVWNEPDIGFGGYQPADQYVPIVKTLHHTLRAAGVDTPIVGGVFAYMNMDYMKLASANGLLDEIDVLSFHYYNDPLSLENRVADVRAWLAANGHGNKPIWITEMGRRWRGGKGVGPTPDQQRDTARAIAMQGVEARACGIAGWFPFVYPSYREGENNFGLTDANGLPLRPLAAVAQVSRALTGASYLGDLVLDDQASAAKRIRVFDMRQAGRVLIVLYTDDAPSGTQVRLPFPVVSVTGIDGRILRPRAHGSSTFIPVPDGLAYVVAERAKAEAFLRTDTEASRLVAMEKMAPPDRPAAESPVVLQPLVVLKGAGIRATTRGYHLPEGDDVHVPVTLRVNNLGTTSATVAVSHELADGTSSPSSDVVVKGGSFGALDYNIDPSTLPKAADGSRSLVFSATSAEVARIAPARLTLLPWLGLDAYLARYAYQFPLPIGDMQRWRGNANGKLTFEHESPEAKWGFRVLFHGGDRWAYPRFSLPQEVALDRVTGVLVRARCARPATVRLMSWNESDAWSVTAAPIFPADGKWSVVYIPLSDWVKTQNDGAALGRQLKDVSIGINSLSDENLVEVSDFYLLGN